jgi:hypothetical protein
MKKLAWWGCKEDDRPGIKNRKYVLIIYAKTSVLKRGEIYEKKTTLKGPSILENP